MEITWVRFSETGVIRLELKWGGATHDVSLTGYAPPLKGQRKSQKELVSQVLPRSDVISDIQTRLGATQEEVRAAVSAYVQAHG